MASSVQAAIILAIRNQDGSISYLASDQVESVDIEFGTRETTYDTFENASSPWRTHEYTGRNPWRIAGLNLRPWEPSWGVPDPPQRALTAAPLLTPQPTQEPQP